ncbi:hypothetical protein A1O3_06666 [Capronia epimyces CBS 606.96]|uniref:BTB domain-containing protein n=1 Tax=Capronia epimyces CBS 606.96 TaxID=1182542 RepID=W9Y0X0_9EURO|nr:uncharacterized protein A1O3_06666 [Capronia epimyces CBS 606.96]EXJ82851.1 hypothetical protein A1O3_06666 [Capronia epimyces CBS 606.96]
MDRGIVTAVQPPQVPYGTEFVILILGKQKQKFLIHKNLLCASSGFFNDVFNSDFVQVGDQQYTLPHDDPGLFHLVQDWLYSGRVPESVSCYMNNETSSHTDEFWWNVYGMGQRLDMSRIKILAVEKLQGLFSTTSALIPSTEFIASLFTSGLSPLLEEVVVGHVAYWLLRSKANPVWSPLPEAHERFGTNLAYAMMKNIRRNLVVHPLDPSHGIMPPADLAAFLADDSAAVFKSPFLSNEALEKPLQTCPISDLDQHHVSREPATTEGVQQYQTNVTSGWEYETDLASAELGWDDPLPCPPPTPTFKEPCSSPGPTFRSDPAILWPAVPPQPDFDVPLTQPPEPVSWETFGKTGTASGKGVERSSDQVIYKSSSILSALKSILVTLESTRRTLDANGMQGKPDDYGYDHGDANIDNDGYAGWEGDYDGCYDDEDYEGWGREMTPEDHENGNAFWADGKPAPPSQAWGWGV